MSERETMSPRGTDSGGRAAGSSDPGEPLPPPSIGGESFEFSATEIIGSPEPLAVDGFDERPPVSGIGITLRRGTVRIGDRVLAGLTSGAGVFVVALIGLVAIFLIAKAAPVIRQDTASFLFSRGWQVDTPPLKFGVVDLLWVTVISSLVALVIAVPIAIGIGLFITQYAPQPIRRPVGYVIDLLAAIPSIIYGIWGIYVLAPHLSGVQRALYHLGWIPLFKNENVPTGTIFDASVVLAVMILPIITAICREVYERTPSDHIEAAWALGATKWEMIRMAILPYGRAGMVSGAMLGLGRALGETIAVMLILTKPANDAPFTPSIFAGGQTFASLIGLNMQEANGATQTGAYISAGLVLFVLTFAVNAAARAIVNRRKEFV